MQVLKLIFAAAVASFVASTTATARDRTPVVVDLVANPQPMVTVAIKQDKVDTRVALNAAGGFVLDQVAGPRSRIKAFPFIGKQTIKDSLIPGGQATVRFNRYTVSSNGLPKHTLWAGWVDKPIDDHYQGLIGPADLGADIVNISQPSAPAGGSEFTIPLDSEGTVYAKTKIGETMITVQLGLDAPFTAMNAAAAEAMEKAGLVTRTGRVDHFTPFPGVSLPVEHLATTPAAKLFGLPILEAAARITEERARALDAKAKAGTSTADDQEDAIVVNAKKTKKKPRRGPWLLIGRDVLGNCSRITLDLPAKQWRLTCDFGAHLG